MSKLCSRLAQTWLNIQTSLFPWLSEELGELTGQQLELVTTLEMIRVEGLFSAVTVNQVDQQMIGGL